MNQKLISVLVGGIVNIVLGSSYFLLVVFYGVSILQITPEKIGIPVLIGALIFALLFPMFGGLTSFFWLFKKSSGAIKIFDAAVVGALSGILCAIALIIFLFNDARKSHQDMDVSLCALIVVWFAVTSLVGASIGAFFYRNHKSKAKAAAGY